MKYKNEMKKMKTRYNENNIHLLYNLLLILLFCPSIFCILEFPVEIIKIKSNFNKYSFNIEESSSKIFPKIFMEEAVTKINSNHLFLTNIKIGSKSQSFRLILDTGSSITWVSDINSQIKNIAQTSNQFNPQSSSTCQILPENFNIKYGTGQCSGYYCVDVIQYLNNKKFMLKFGVAKNALFDFEEADGIIGLSRYNEEIATSFINMLYLEKIIDSKKFSLKFASNNLHIPTGKLFIGKHDDFNKKNAFNCDLIERTNDQKYFWTCELKSFQLKNSYSLLSSNYTCNIIFDTGTNFIFLPYEYIEQLGPNLENTGCKITEYVEDGSIDNINNFANKNNFRLVCPTYDLPKIRFMLGNTTFIIPNHLLFYFDKGYAYSYILFIKSKKKFGSSYIFGAPFFMSFHTLFNNDDKKMEFYPLDPSYISIEDENIIKKMLIIIGIISLLLSVIYSIYFCFKLKREEAISEYESINKTDFNIEMSAKFSK